MNIELLPHNEEAEQKLEACLENNQFATINHATGTGKSFILLKYLYKNRDKRILYIAPTYPIIDQFINEHPKELNIKKEDFKCLDTIIYKNILKSDTKALADYYDIIVLDEYHRCGAPKWGKKVKQLEKEYLDLEENKDNITKKEELDSRITYEKLKQDINWVLDTLTEREKQVLQLRYGLKDPEPKTLEEVGKVFDVTRERIRQIELKALRKLRHPSRSRIVKGYLNIDLGTLNPEEQEAYLIKK